MNDALKIKRPVISCDATGLLEQLKGYFFFSASQVPEKPLNFHLPPMSLSVRLLLSGIKPMS